MRTASVFRTGLHLRLEMNNRHHHWKEQVRYPGFYFTLFLIQAFTFESRVGLMQPLYCFVV